MTKYMRLALIASAWLLLPGAAETQAQHFPLESTDRLELHNLTAEPATMQGKKGLQPKMRIGVDGERAQLNVHATNSRL